MSAQNPNFNEARALSSRTPELDAAAKLLLDRGWMVLLHDEDEYVDQNEGDWKVTLDGRFLPYPGSVGEEDRA